MIDKTGREIVRGDLVKVYHFTAALRRKRHYMYKQCLGLDRHGRMEFSSLDFRAHTYTEANDDLPRQGYEIVQSLDCEFDKRPRT